MKPISRIILALILTGGSLMLLASGVPEQSPQDPEVLFQRAVQLETIEGDLNAAIDLYRQVVENNGNHRSLAAKALLRLGGCYEKQGKEEARKTYQELISNYSDQQVEVKLARSRLAALTSETAKDSGIMTRQVWSGPEVEFSGRPSPDGRYLSYSHSTGNLAIRELATGETQRITTDASKWTAEGWGGNSLFSPDGRQVVYEWGQWDSWLRLSSLDGSETRVLLPVKHNWWIVPCDWSSDGRYVLIHYYPADGRRFSQIATIAVADGSLRVVKTLDPGQPRDSRNMWFSPDGQYIVYDVLPPGAQNNRDLAIVSVDGSLESSLVENPADDYVLGWSPDGRSVVFASNRSGAYSIWAIPVSKGQPDGESRLLKRDVGPIRPLGFTHDGTLFYAQVGSMTGYDLDVYGVNIDLDQGNMGETRLIVQSHRGLNSFPDWSPDGRYLAYVSGRPDSKSYVISIRDEKTGEEREIHPELIELARFEIRWSPDGRSFLATGQDREQRDGLFLVDAQTGKVKSPLLRGEQVTGAFFDAQWMPDGRRIVYATNRRRPEVISRIVVLDPETGSEQEILRMTDLRLIGFLALSPDGSRLAFTAHRLTGGTDGGAIASVALMVIPASGGEMRELFQSKFPEIFSSLVWSRDSRSILFMRANVSVPEIEQGTVWQIPAAGGEPRRLGVVPGLVTRGRLSLHPDGRRIVYTRGERRFEIWAMENLLPLTQGR
jgi:Tol biopolymer transport system component